MIVQSGAFWFWIMALDGAAGAAPPAAIAPAVAAARRLRSPNPWGNMMLAFEPGGASRGCHASVQAAWQYFEVSATARSSVRMSMP
ncbi:hypothetical protein KRR38_25950 [Novosphingobium sp. G106]|uniref:hypothetical protein n=1 Tax=Novosphingobium sp. G106 TaxID=2849500 RepID=UPI001C2D7B0A|nr:hypothetical protein [Novosphingobium sp. G106]MBV1691028.1 hypothetical protein [Novosphingobium sp. G106]